MDYAKWKEARMGAVTASRFADVMTEPRTKAAKEAGEWSESAKGYAMQLVAERLTGLPCDAFGGNEATKWGNEHESTAIEEACAILGEKFGELSRPNGRAYVPHPKLEWVGCSPDALADGIGLEIKCPFNPANHVRTLLFGMPNKHEAQIQGTLWITGCETYVFVSYDPRVKQQPLYVRHVKRDEEFIGRLETKVVAFRDYVEKLYDQLAEPF